MAGNETLAAGIRSDPLAFLRQAGEQPDDAIDPGALALALAAPERPRVPLTRYLDHLDELAAAAGQAAGVTDAAGQVKALVRAIAEEAGYLGDAMTYDDLQNANLMRVIDRRRGLPVALGLLYMATGRRLGWTVEGLSFPGHFLIRVGEGADRLIVDPFGGGRVLHAADLRGLIKTMAGPDAELEPAHWQAVPVRAVLLRLQNNVKIRLMQRDDLAGALDHLERMTALAPDHADIVYEAAMLSLKLENFGGALTYLDRYIDLESDPAALHRAAVLVQQVRSRLN